MIESVSNNNKTFIEFLAGFTMHAPHAWQQPTSKSKILVLTTFGDQRHDTVNLTFATSIIQMSQYDSLQLNFRVNLQQFYNFI